MNLIRLSHDGATLDVNRNVNLNLIIFQVPLRQLSNRALPCLWMETAG